MFQSPGSPFNLTRLGTRPLPLLRFSDNCPVYFDRHTLSVKDRQLSMYTLDGRMRFELALQPAHEAMFHELKLQEIVLSRRVDGAFELRFSFVDAAAASTVPDEGPELALTPNEPALPALQQPVAGAQAPLALPEYVMVEEAA